MIVISGGKLMQIIIWLQFSVYGFRRGSPISLIPDTELRVNILHITGKKKPLHPD
jgi:hypothetical protein